MSSPPGASPLLRWLALATAASAWVLVVVGGAVRVTESGLGCPDWPLCDGRVVPTAQKEPIVEYTHRATAAVVVVLLLLTAGLALRGRDRRARVALPFGLALALVPVQALLGAIVVWLELPDRLVGVHFMVGMVMLALTCLGAVGAWRGETVTSPTFARTSLAAGAVALLLVSLGASVVATDGMHACGQEWPACNGTILAGGGTAALQVAHRTTAYVLAGIALALLALGLRSHAPLRLAAPLAALVTVQVGFGIGVVLSSHGSTAHELVRIFHIAGSGAVWACACVLVGVAALAPEHSGPGVTRREAAQGRSDQLVLRARSLEEA
ncbi:MAG: COX15/CtaA family protein [Gaiellales bacterium]